MTRSESILAGPVRCGPETMTLGERRSDVTVAEVIASPTANVVNDAWGDCVGELDDSLACCGATSTRKRSAPARSDFRQLADRLLHVPSPLRLGRDGFSRRRPPRVTTGVSGEPLRDGYPGAPERTTVSVQLVRGVRCCGQGVELKHELSRVGVAGKLT
jgi:hypothetical protein